ncbi:putative holin-like toxin [Oceanobacillus zhaokaii]
MSVYEALMFAIAFAALIVSILADIDRKK